MFGQVLIRRVSKGFTVKPFDKVLSWNNLLVKAWKQNRARKEILFLQQATTSLLPRLSVLKLESH